MTNTKPNLNIRAQVFGNTGYTVHAREFILALSKLASVNLLPKHGSSEVAALKAGAEAGEEDCLSLLRLCGKEVDNAVSICLDYPDLIGKLVNGSTRIGYTVFENSVLPREVIESMSDLDQVWVPTNWGRELLVNNHGLNSEKVKVVPEGVNVERFKPNLSPLAELDQFEGFKFLAVSKWETRKGVVELLQAFDRAFAARKDVWLVAHFTTHVQALEKIDVGEEIDKLNLSSRSQILLLPDMIDGTSALPRLYNSCNAFVSASHAEGWCLPLCEAMACGLPVIAPNYSGPTEYLTAKNSFLLPVDQMIDAHCPYFLPAKDGRYGKWAKIDVNKLAGLLKLVESSPEATKEYGEQAKQDMQTKWTWDNAAQVALNHLIDNKPYL